MLCVLKTQMEHLILWDFLLSLNVGFSGLHDPENFFFIDQVKIMLDHQLHDAGCDGKIDQLLRIKTVDQAVKKPTGKGITGANGLQTVNRMDRAVIEFAIL